MAPTFVAAATADTGSGNVTELTISVPAGTADGDVMVAFLAQDGGNSSNIATPTGWNLAGGGLDLVAFFRVANSEPASYTFTSSASDGITGGIVTFTGADAPTVYSVAEDTSGNTTMDAPSVTGTTDHLLVCGWGSDHSGSVAPLTFPASMTEAFTEHTQGDTDFHPTVACAYEALTADGATGLRQVTTSGDGRPTTGGSIVIPPGLSAVTVAVGTATEVEAATAVTATPGAVSTAVGAAAETDAAVAVTATASVTTTVTPTAETEAVTAVASSATVSAAVGATSETEAAQVVTPVGSDQVVAVGAAAETESAVAATATPGTFTAAIGTVAETEAAVAAELATVVSLAIGATSETETAQAIRADARTVARILVGVAYEFDQAQAVTRPTGIEVLAAYLVLGHLVEVGTTRQLSTEEGLEDAHHARPVLQRWGTLQAEVSSEVTP